MSPRSLEASFTAAVTRINNAPSTPNVKRHMPIFQRNNTGDRQRQAVKDAASALSALWKVRDSMPRT